MRRLLIFLVIVFCCFSCENQSSKNKKLIPKFRAEHGFYAWKTNWQNPAEDSNFTQFKTNHLYVRMFDVEWSDELDCAVPVSPLNFENTMDDFNGIQNFVPVIYITNETFKHLSDSAAKQLPQQIYQKLRILFYQMNEQDQYEDYVYKDGEDPYQILHPELAVKKLKNLDSLVDNYMSCFNEIQFDCDWTPSTKDKYFTFLRACKKRFNDKTISATIRLYPFKYRKEMGVPPVDKGMLMCYNVGNIQHNDGINSIFDLKEIQKYLPAKFTYPLPLDYALPIFSWGASYRNGQLNALFDASILEDYAFNFEKNKQQDTDESVVKYTVLSNYSFTNLTLKEGDQVRKETVDLKSVEKLAEILGQKNTNTHPRVILYQLDQSKLESNAKEIKSIFDTF
jgi:hypothetical protein